MSKGGKAGWFYFDPSHYSAKGKGKGKPTGKGKGKDGKGATQVEGYYFDLFPDAAKGRPVVKCKTPTCFGCCLYGDSPPKTCNKCKKDFDFTRFRGRPAEEPANRSRDSSVNSAGSKSSNKANNNRGNVLYTELLKTHEQDRALEITRNAFPNFKPVLESPSTFSQSVGDIQKQEGKVLDLRNKLKGQIQKAERLQGELDESIETGNLLVSQIEEAEAELLIQRNKAATHLGLSRVTLEKAKDLRDDKAETHVVNLDSFINNTESAQHIKDQALTELMNLISSTQVIQARADLDKKDSDNKIRELQAQVKLLENTVAGKSTATRKGNYTIGRGKYGVMTAEEEDEDDPAMTDVITTSTTEVTSLVPAIPPTTTPTEITSLAVVNPSEPILAQRVEDDGNKATTALAIATPASSKRASDEDVIAQWQQVKAGRKARVAPYISASGSSGNATSSTTNPI